MHHPRSPHRTQVVAIDISRAYFKPVTPEDEPTLVELPPEVGAPPGMCGLLECYMYGTRRAADGWQNECSSTLRGLGFAQEVASACVFRHKERPLVCSVHGDDVTVARPGRRPRPRSPSGLESQPVRLSSCSLDVDQLFVRRIELVRGVAAANVANVVAGVHSYRHSCSRGFCQRHRRRRL